MSENYLIYSFAAGFEVEFELLLSVYKHILSHDRMRTTSMLLEAVLFLKINKSYCDLKIVSNAIRTARSEKISQHLTDIALQDELVDILKYL